MAIAWDVITGPAYWVSALVNGDYSGLDENEAAWCRAWQEKIAPWYVVSTVDGEDGEGQEPYFSKAYDLHAMGFCPDGVTAGSVLDYIVHKRA